MSHPMGVASITWENGGSEDQVIAALLHDVCEDCGITPKALEKKFGKSVAQIVTDCSDSMGTANSEKAPWKKRKTNYLLHLKSVSASTLLVSLADKSHNLRAILRDHSMIGKKIWSRFNAKPKESSWYYQELNQVFQSRKNDFNSDSNSLLMEFDRLISALALVSK